MSPATAPCARAPGGAMRAPGSQCIFTVLAISGMRGPQNGWLAGSHFSEFMHAAGLPGCIQGCLHACEWDFQLASQPASQGPAAARYGQDSENAVAARRAHGHPRRARARGSRRRHIVACSRARARQQIKISQNLGTPVPKRGKNGWADCSRN